MSTVIAILIFLVCLVLIGVILIQNSKGGGLAANLSSSNQVMGVRKTADFLEKATWTLAITLLVLSLISSAVSDTSTESAEQSAIKEYVNQNQPVQAPGNFQQQQKQIPSPPGQALPGNQQGQKKEQPAQSKK